MQIKVDDWVVHPQHGLGRVVKLAERDFGSGTKKEYYEISIPTGTMWVPVEGKLSGLRKVTVKSRLARYRGLLSARPKPLDADYRQRTAALLERLKKGSFDARCELLRDLHAHSRIKPLNDSGGAMLRKIQRMVCDEWAMAAGASLSEATQEVEALLRQGRMTDETAD